MRKCHVCHDRPATWTWQPCGPGENLKLFTLPGHHYRGFLALPVCDDCKARVERGDDVAFTYKRQPYVAAGALQKVVASPF